MPLYDVEIRIREQVTASSKHEAQILVENAYGERWFDVDAEESGDIVGTPLVWITKVARE
jgi:hypothetical protein